MHFGFLISGLPRLTDSLGVLQCSVTDLNVVGDHHVWYGTVIEADIDTDNDSHPMLYYKQ